MLRHAFLQECEATLDSAVPTKVCLGPSELHRRNLQKSIDMQLKLDALLLPEGFDL